MANSFPGDKSSAIIGDAESRIVRQTERTGPEYGGQMVRYLLTTMPAVVAVVATLGMPAVAQFKDQRPPPPTVDREREAILTCVIWNEQLDTREAMFDFDCAYRMIAEPDSDAALECERVGLRLDEETEIFNESCGQYFPR